MKDNNRKLRIFVALVVFFSGFVLPEMSGLSRGGMQVMGIFLGTLILWLTVAIDWPSILCMGGLALVTGLNMKEILSSSFGNSTFAFLVFTFLCTHALSETPFIRRCAMVFVTSKWAKKGPWFLAILFFISILLVGSFISPTVLFIIYLPIIEEIYHVLHLKKGDSAASMLMIGLVICCGISSGMTPIAHVFPLMALGFFQEATKEVISYTQYMAYAIPIGILSFLASLAIFRYIMKPDMSTLQIKDLDQLQLEEKKMGGQEKKVLFVFALVVALWVLPDLTKSILPGFAGKMKGLGTAFPPLLGVVALSVLSEEGKPLLNFSDGMKHGIPWAALVMASGTLALGSALSNPEIGLTDQLGKVIAPVAQTMAPIAMVFILTLWAAIQTNLSSNMVTVTVVTAIAIPITLATQGAVNTAAVCAIIGTMASFSFAFPPAMPCVAIAGASGWTTAKALAIYGSIIAFASVLIATFIGYPLANILM
ncbi:MAG: SLC13 family permease [Tissierellia bacterium]|nr:SLC13 family permease [Tissierellia bacterium]